MNGSWDRTDAHPGDSVTLTGSYDAHDAGVALEVAVYAAADVGSDGPNAGASAVATVPVTETAERTSFSASWDVAAPAAGSDGFVFCIRLSDGSQTAVSSKLAVAADQAPADPNGQAPADPNAAPPADPNAQTPADPNAQAPADPNAGAGAAPKQAGTPQNLAWDKGDGTAITSAGAGDSVTLTFDLPHDDQNQVTVVVLASDQSTQVGTPYATERGDGTGFTAPWLVPDQGDGFYFKVTVTNPNVDPAPEPVLSEELTVGAAAPETPLQDYYYPGESPKLDYVVHVTPQPPADSGEVLYHQGSQTGTVLQKGDLVTAGTGTLQVDLSCFHPATDSPVFLEFTFTKDGHEDQGAFRAIALAAPAPATIAAPADAKPGDSIQLQVTAWNAVVFDTPGTGTPKPESDTSRIPQDTQSAVKWKVGGQDVSDAGTQISYTIPADASGALDVEASLDGATDFPAKATVQLGGAAATQSQDPGTLTVHLTIDPPLALDEFVLTSSDGSYTQTKTIADDHQDADPSDGNVELQFDGLDATKTYSLQVIEPGRAAYYVFQNVAYSDVGGTAAAS